jgi:hypothetical protein
MAQSLRLDGPRRRTLVADFRCRAYTVVAVKRVRGMRLWARPGRIQSRHGHSARFGGQPRPVSPDSKGT